MTGGEQIILWSLLVAATVTDLLWGKIHNVLTFPLMLLGIGYRFVESGLPGASQAFLAIAVAFALFFPLYYIKTFAAGDVKLLMAIGAWADVNLVIRVGVFAVLIGAIVGTYLMLRRRGIAASVSSVAKHFQVERVDKSKSYRMPLAPAFLCALLLVQIAEINHWPFLF